MALEDGVSPRIAGLRVIPIPVSGDEGKVVFVIQIPQGTTAHQAVRQCIYYGRSEFEARPLQDRDVRLRMERSRAPRLELNVQTAKRLRLLTDEEERQKAAFVRFRAAAATEEEIAEAVARALALPVYDHSAIQSALGIKNVGEVTVREFALEVTPTFPRGFWVGPGVERDAKDMPRDDSPARVIQVETNSRLFPGQVKPLSRPKEAAISLLFLWNKDRSTISDSCRLTWHAYLDNASPIEGEILLAEALAGPFSQPEHRLSAPDFNEV
jgi:hypothetical protein